ncbi:MAG: type II secretion system protein, partial [Candidatus Paceibacterota bacterium]
LRNYRTRCLNKNVNAGFTLMELLVSLTLFTVVIVMAVGTLLVLIDANTKAQNMQEAMTNLTFALDSMTREIRTGSGYFCHQNNAWNINLTNDSTRDCINSTTGISFVEGGSSLTKGSGGNRIGYRFAKNAIQRKVGTRDWQPLTSDAVVIEEMRITVRNSETYFPSRSNILQPTVTIFIRGSAGTIENVDTSFSMQTTITRRIWDL